MGTVLDDSDLHSCRASPRFWTPLISLQEETYLLRGQEAGAPFSRACRALSPPPPPPSSSIHLPQCPGLPMERREGAVVGI